MSNLIKKLDVLADEFEARGEFQYASTLDKISQLLITADQDIPQEISSLADLLRRHLSIAPEEAIAVAQELFVRYSEGGSEVSGDGDFFTNYFPSGALPNKERRQGPRPCDVPIGTAEWWK